MCHFPGTRSCRVNGFGSSQHTSIVVGGWSVRKSWKYFQRWGTRGKLIFFFPKWGFYFMTISFDLKSIKVKLFCASFDALECSLSLQWPKWFQFLEIHGSEDSLVYCWHYCWRLEENRCRICKDRQYILDSGYRWKSRQVLKCYIPSPDLLRFYFSLQTCFDECLRIRCFF